MSFGMKISMEGYKGVTKKDNMVNRRIKRLLSENGICRSVDRILFQIEKKEYQERESMGNGGDTTFAHVTYCVAPNIGDTVLSQCVRRTFESRIRVADWRIFPVVKEVNSNTIIEINKCGALVIGGGGLFLPDTNSNSISGWQWAISKEQLDQIHRPIYVYSVGYNYFKGQEPGDIFVDSLHYLVKKSTFFGLRNMGSVEVIRRLLPDGLSSKIVFQPCTTTLIRKLFKHEMPKKKETGSIAINMAFDRLDLRYGKSVDLILKQVAKAIRIIETKGYKIFYVCHCWDDDKFLPYLREKNIKYVLVDLSRQFPMEAYLFYNKMDVVLGMRGHAQMIPFGLNCEIISLGTHDKMKWFLDDIKANDWYVDLSESINTISDRIINTFERIHEDERDYTENRLIQAQENLWRITQKNLGTIEER